MEHKGNRENGISSLGLHLLAMGLMLCDHLWATIIPGQEWMAWAGRLAFPMFAFLIAQGYAHTRDLAQYRKRLLIGALLSEIPFNLMYGGSWIYPFQQNVLWTFLLALWCLETMDRQKKKYPLWAAVPLMALTAGAGFLAGKLAMADYSGYGVLTVILFHLFRGRGWPARLGQLAGMLLIHGCWIKGLVVPVSLGQWTWEIPRQGFAVLALLPIWCYRGRQGPHSTWIRWMCYGFYPVHMLILGLIF